MAVETIHDGVVVSLTYILQIDGKEIERAESDDPLEYLHGTGSIVPGLETLLEGKRIGDKLHTTLPPEQAYGEYDADDVEEIERGTLSSDIDLEKGLEVEVEDEEGNWYVATITNLTDDTITLDFNPPLAGQTLTYDVTVLALREATASELDHGHVH